MQTNRYHYPIFTKSVTYLAQKFTTTTPELKYHLRARFWDGDHEEWPARGANVRAVNAILAVHRDPQCAQHIRRVH